MSKKLAKIGKVLKVMKLIPDIEKIIYDYWIYSQCSAPDACISESDNNGIHHMIGICKLSGYCVFCHKKTGSIGKDCELHHESCPYWVSELCDVGCHNRVGHHEICRSRGKPVITNFKRLQ